MTQRTRRMIKGEFIAGVETVHRLQVEAEAYIAGAARCLQGNADNMMLETALDALEKAKMKRIEADKMQRTLIRSERYRAWTKRRRE
jgi:hypothetical protein